MAASSRKKSTSKKRGTGGAKYSLIPIVTIVAFCAIILAVVAAVSNSGGDDTDTDSSYSTDNSEGAISGDEVVTENDHDDEEITSDDGSTGSGTSEGAATVGSTDVNETSDATDDSLNVTAGADNTQADSETTDAQSYETTKSSETTASGDVSIDYPSVDTDSVDVDADTAAKVNELIREYMDEKIQAEALDSDPEMTGEYKYEITSTETTYESDTFMSLLISGEFYVTDTSHPTTFCYTVNVDLSNVKILSSAELIYDFSAVKSLFTDGEFTLSYGIDGLLDETNYEDMIIGYRSEYGIYPDIYYTDDGFGIVIELVYALGGYATFEISSSSVSGYVYLPQ